jgi:syntaxin-binding protein 1
MEQETGKTRKPHFKYKAREDAYDGSRFQPSVKSLLEEHFSNSLDVDLFPYVRDAPMVTAPPSVLSRLASSTSTTSSAYSNYSSGTTATSVTPGSLRSTRATWAEKAVMSNANSQGGGNLSERTANSLRSGGVKNGAGVMNDGGIKQRVMVFVAGGMTYSEIRSVYEVSEGGPGRDVFIGT